MRRSLIYSKLFLAFFFCVLLESCGPHEPGIWKNEKIESGIRDDFHKLNNHVLDALKANSSKQLESFMSKEFIADNGKLRTIELCSNRLKEDEYILRDEYYAVNKGYGYKTVVIKDQNINNYSFKYYSGTPETYIAFFVPKSIPNKWMLTATYRKYDYGWKLTQLDLNPYTINGKTAPELFEYAKQLHEKKFFVDAFNASEHAKKCLTPYGGWSYPDNEKIVDLSRIYIKEINKKYLFPFYLNQVPSRPRVFSITTRTTPEGIFPMVYYLSTIKLNNIAALKKENDNIKKVIGQAFLGIDKNKKHILYAAFNTWPKYNQSVDRYEMIDTLK